MLFEYLAGRRTLDAPRPEDEHIISVQIARRLQEHLSVNAVTITKDGVSLVAGFNVLLSTWLEFNKSVTETGQSPRNYLLFLKTRWILEQILASDEYKAARPGFYYRRAVNRIAYETLKTMRQPTNLRWYPECDILNLPDTDFRIWPIPSVKPPTTLAKPSPRMLRTNEKKVAHLLLASNGLSAMNTVKVFKSAED